MNLFVNRSREGTCLIDGDVLEVFGFDSLKRRGDPLGARIPNCSQELDMFELCGLGEVMCNHYSRTCVCELR